ncbi:Bacteriophage/Gene transfer agent portal protein [uncultured Caudovirales phage]|uniref:Bacteriophage/Gene transfer agent portal protein n=1 Tax=uncultured Caudovirales phage TaxID=2100421 RepID=A0A6J5N077_9CAUD|nr:Bacteriophage/Gene transfer agent portal protein [uncultured Caudovirales phage]
MTLRETLRIIGQGIRGKSNVEPTVVSGEIIPPTTIPLLLEEKRVSVVGATLEMAIGKLSDERNVSKKLLEANREWVFKNNDVIAKEVAQIKFTLYKLSISKSQVVYTEVEDHPLLQLLDRFNSANTTSDALYNTQSHKKLAGDAFWLLIRNGKTITDIFLLPPDKITVLIGDPTKGSHDLIDGYDYDDVIDGKEVKMKYSKDDIIHFKAPNPNNMFRGLGTVEASADTIDIDNLTNETTRKFFKQGAIANFILTTESALSDDQLRRMRAEFSSAYGGVKNAYKTMIFGGGVKPERIAFSNKDMEFLSQLEWYRDKLMVLFGNTKASLGIIDDVNRATHASSMIAWKRNSVKPEMKSIVDTLNEFLVPMFGTNLVLGFDDPVPEDREAKLSEAKDTKDILSINERRAILGYEPAKGGDIIPSIESNRRADQMVTPVAPAPVKSLIPDSLKDVNLEPILRRQRWYEKLEKYQQLKAVALPLAREIIKNRKKEVIEEARESSSFTNDQVWAYWAKQINVVDQYEKRFEEQVVKYITYFEKIVLENLDAEISGRKKKSKNWLTADLLDNDELLTKAELDFTPLLMEEIAVAGGQALRLISVDDPYIPYSIKDVVKTNVKKFTQSMLKTDRDKLIAIISEGLTAGESVPTIRSNIQGAFDTFKKNQAQLITRTEVIKASNMASVDAWEQSGVVMAKQWLTAEDDRVDSELCAPMNGKTIGLRDKFFKKGEEFNGHIFDYESIKQPPLHPGCRCVLLPVLEDQKGFEPALISEKATMKAKIAELEAKSGKSAKELKKIRAERSDDKAYIKSLEKMLPSSDKSE